VSAAEPISLNERLHTTTVTTRDLLAHSSVKRWEVFAKASYSRELEVVAGARPQLVESEETGVAVRTFRHARCGFAAASGLEAGAARSAVDGALAGEVPTAIDPLPPPHLLGVAPLTAPTALAPQEWARQVAGHMRDALDVVDHSLQLQRLVFHEGVFTWLLTTGEGFVASHEASSRSLEVQVAAAGSETGVWREWLSIPDYESFRPDVAATQIGNRIALTRTKVQLGSGLKDVILHPEVAAHVLAALVPLFLATPAEHDQLPRLLNKEGLLTSPVLSLFENRADPTSPACGPCDGEGLPGRRTVLLAEGVPRHRLACYCDALLCSEMPRGGAVRLSYQDYPVSGISGMQVLTDQAMTPGQMLDETDRALYLVRPLAPVLLDWSRDTYQLLAVGVWINGGQVQGLQPVAQLRGSIGQLLRRIEAVGADARWFQTDQGFVKASTLLLRRQSINT